jgi:hypothetical protein
MLGCSHLDCSQRYILLGHTGYIPADRTVDNRRTPLEPLGRLGRLGRCSIDSDIRIDRTPLHTVGIAAQVGTIVLLAGTSLRPAERCLLVENCC